MRQLDWQALEDELNQHGCAIVPGVLDAETCVALAAQYDAAQLFRSRVVMERHGFGRGEYQYFAYPLPQVVALAQGDAVIFPVFHRPVNGTRGSYRVQMRHGISRLRTGLRHTLGIIFHGAN
jgi:hypothetical protein